jgi:hypothetical protein
MDRPGSQTDMTLLIDFIFKVRSHIVSSTPTLHTGKSPSIVLSLIVNT